MASCVRKVVLKGEIRLWWLDAGSISYFFIFPCSVRVDGTPSVWNIVECSGRDLKIRASNWGEMVHSFTCRRFSSKFSHVLTHSS